MEGEAPLETVLAALADPVRLRIVRTLRHDGPRACGEFDLGIPKSTASHHFKVLREAGVTTYLERGTQRIVSLREDLEARFPGLLDVVASAE